MGDVLLVSDLHLPTGPSPLRAAFLRLLTGPARRAQALYILGDLFEYWIGDDAGLQDYAPEVAQLAVLAQSGVRIGLMHGNRDFMVGRDFCELTGITLLPDPIVLSIGGVPTLLSHGDLLCTDDVPYQRWRRVSRNAAVQGLYRLLPRAARERIAGGVRQRSSADKRDKSDSIMDVNDDAVRRLLARHEVVRLIHGHTHRPADHRLQVDGHECERIVLADWRPERVEYLRCDAGGCARVALA